MAQKIPHQRVRALSLCYRSMTELKSSICVQRPAGPLQRFLQRLARPSFASCFGRFLSCFKSRAIHQPYQEGEG